MPFFAYGLLKPSEPGHRRVTHLVRQPEAEAFCRRQEALVGKGWVRRRAAPWQEALPQDLRRFWKQMGQRARA